jgi:hypothetical protein
MQRPAGASNASLLAPSSLKRIIGLVVLCSVAIFMVRNIAMKDYRVREEQCMAVRAMIILLRDRVRSNKRSKCWRRWILTL